MSSASCSDRARHIGLAISLVCLVFVSTSLSAKEIGSHHNIRSAWTFTFENDLFVGDDSRYTNGIGILYGKGLFDQFTPEMMPRWLHTLVGGSYINRVDSRQRAIVFGLYQAMQTPNNIVSSELQVDDVPYVGLLAAHTELYAMNETKSDRLTLTLGVVGPLSLAEQAQETIHQAIDSDDPGGWQHQLRNEPVAMIELQRGNRIWHTDPARGIELDTVVLSSGSLGNLLSEVAATFVLRIGNNLADSFPTVSVLPNRGVNPIAFSSEFSWDIFAGVRSAYIFNDISVDGNSFTDSHSIELDHTQSQLSVGVNWNFASWAFTATVSEFHNVSDSDPFGAFSITRRTR